jgi:hypothetical protein
MIWPSPETATVQIFAGTLDLPQRSPSAADARLAPFPEPETAPPEKPTIIHRDGVRIETELRMTATSNAFLLQGSLRAFEGANEVCRRDWDRTVARDFS